MSRSRAATFSLYIIVALFLPISLAHADGKAADLMCNPVKAECGCGQLKDKDGKCKKVGEKENMYLCKCFDKTTVGKCTEPNYCEGGDKCVGIDCAKPTEQQIKDSMQSGGLPGAPGNSTPDAPATATGLKSDGSNIGPGSSVIRSVYESMTNPALNQSGSQTPEPGSSPWSNSNSAQNFNEFVAQQAQIGQSPEQQQANSDTSIGGALQRWGADFLHLDGGSQSLTPVNANGDFVGDSIQTRDFNPNGSTFSQSDSATAQGDTPPCGWVCTIQDYAGKAWDAVAKEFGGGAEAKNAMTTLRSTFYDPVAGQGGQKDIYGNRIDPRGGTMASNVLPQLSIQQACLSSCTYVLVTDTGAQADLIRADANRIGLSDDMGIARVTYTQVGQANSYAEGMAQVAALNNPTPLPVASPMRFADTAITNSVTNGWGGSYPDLPSGESVTQQFLDASTQQIQNNAIANTDFATSGDTGISTGVAPAHSNPDFASSGDTGIASPAQEFPASPSGVVTQGPELGQPNPVGEVTRGPDLAPIPGESVLSRSVISNESGIGVDFAAYQDIAGHDLTAAQVQEINDQGLADRLALADQQQAAIDAIPKPDTTLPTGEALTNQILKSVESQVPVPEAVQANLPTQDEMISALVPKPDTTVPSGEAVTAEVLASAPGSRNPFTGPEPIELATQPSVPNSDVPKGLEGLITARGTNEERIKAYEAKLGDGLNDPKAQGVSVEASRAGLISELSKRIDATQQKLDDLPLPKDQTPEQAQQYKDLKASIDNDEAVIAKQSEILKAPIANMTTDQLQKQIDSMKSMVSGFPDTPGAVDYLNAKIAMAQNQIDSINRAAIANIDATARQGREDNLTFDSGGPAGTVAFFQNEYNKVLAEQKNLDDMLNVWNATPEQYMAYDLKTNGLAETAPVDFSKLSLIGAGEQPGSVIGGGITSVPAATVIPSAADVAAEAKPLSGPDARTPLSSDFQTYALDDQKPIAYTDFQKYQSLSGEPLTPEQAHAAGLDNNEFTGKFPDTTKTETVTPKQDPNVALAEQRIANLDANINRAQALLNRNEQDPQTIANAKAAIRAALISADNTTAALKGTGSDTGDIASASARLHQLSAELDNTSLSKGQIQARLNDASAQVSRWDQALPDTPAPYKVTTTIPGATYNIPAMTAAEGVPFADAYSQYQSAVSSGTSVPAQLTGNWEPQYPSDSVFPTQQDYTQIAEQFPAQPQVPVSPSTVAAANPDFSTSGDTGISTGVAPAPSNGTPEPTVKTSDTVTPESPTKCASESCVGGELGDSRSRPLSPEEQALQKQIADAEAQKTALQKQLSTLPANTNVNGLIAKAQAGLDAMHSDRKPTAGEVAAMKEGAGAIRQLQQIARAAGDTEMANDLAGLSSRLNNIDAKGARFAQLSSQSALGDLGAYASPEGHALVGQLQSGVNSAKADGPSVFADVRAADLPGQIQDTRDTIAELSSQISTNRQSFSLLQEANIPRIPDAWASASNPGFDPPVVVGDVYTSRSSEIPTSSWEPSYPPDNLFATSKEITQVADQANLLDNAGSLVSPLKDEPSLASTLDANNPPSPEEVLSNYVQDQLNSLSVTETAASRDEPSVEKPPSQTPTDVSAKQSPGVFDSVKNWAQGTVDQLREFAFNREIAGMVPFQPVEQTGEQVTQQVKDAVAATPELSQSFNDRWSVLTPAPTVRPSYDQDPFFLPAPVVPTSPAPAPAPTDTSVPAPATPAPVVRPSYNPDPFYMPGPESLTPRTPAPAPVVTPAPDGNPAPKPVVIAAPAPVVQPAPGPQSGGNSQPSGVSGGGASGGGFGGALSSMFGSLMRMLGIGQPQQPTPQQPTSPAKPSTTSPSATSTPPTPTVNLIANPPSVVSGKKVTLSWSGIGVTQCVVFAQDGTQLVAGGKSGSVPTPVLTTTTSFRVSCAASVGAPVGASVSVTVR